MCGVLNQSLRYESFLFNQFAHAPSQNFREYNKYRETKEVSSQRS